MSLLLFRLEIEDSNNISIHYLIDSVTINQNENGFNYMSLVDLVKGRKILYEAIL